MQSKHLRYLSFTGLFAAVVFITIRFIPYIPLGNAGYVNLGDVFIYLAVCMLPTPYAAVAGALGAGLADLSFDAALWVVPTIVVKSLLVLCAKWFARNSRGLWRDIRIGLAGWVTVVGYYFAEVLLIRLLIAKGTPWQGAFVGAAASIFGNLAQAVCCGIVFVVLSRALHRIPFFQKYWVETSTKE